MKRCLTYLFVTLEVLFSGCEMAHEYNPSPRENFEALWQMMDQHYCFFEYKEIDWDEVYDRYSSQIRESMDEYALFEVLSNMLNELKDGHTNLISSFDVSRYWAWYEDYPPNFYMEMHRKYLGSSLEYNELGGIKYKMLAKNRIGYIYYESFTINITDGNLDKIFNEFKDCEGLIIDIRDNSGGSLSNADLFASRFTEEKLLVGYMQHKTGKGHSDFSSPYPIYLNPSAYTRWARPVTVLTNRQCYSAANNFVQKMRMLPLVTIIGDRTGGGSGFPFTSELPNGWSVRFSSSPILDANKQHTEFGIDPDIPVQISNNDLMRSIDTILEKAIEFMLSSSKSSS